MTGDNKRRAIAAEIARGDETFESAEILFNAGKFADSVSRAYYAVFHFARALLLSVDEEPRTHSGLERLLHRDFVRPGALPADTAKLFSRLQKFRQDADYTSEFVFTRDGAADEIDAARRFLAEARAILTNSGWA